VALVLLVLLAILAPVAQSASNTSAFIVPRADGSSIVAPGFDATALESTIFPYMTFVERQQGNLSSAWPDLYGVINNDPDTLEGRRAIVGQLLGSTTNLDVRVRDSGLSSNPTLDVQNGLNTAYGQMTASTDQKISDDGINGLGILDLVRSLTMPNKADQYLNERDAISFFQSAAQDEPNVWEYSYNWGLGNYLIGNYQAAYEGMRTAGSNPATANLHQIQVWMGLAALRNGQPDEAIEIFNNVINVQLPTDAADNVQQYFTEARGVAEEALGDAQWAWRNPATAYQTYMHVLSSGNASSGLYRKWLRLGLQQRGYEQMLTDMNTLLGDGLPTDLQGRIHHDRGRLLSFLGQNNAAMSEYKQALQIGQNDPPLLISYGQSLLSSGDTNGALQQAEAAIKGLGKDPSAGDMATTASSVLTGTASLDTREAAQEALDAHLLRAGAWSKQGNSSAIDNLVTNITGSAANQPNDVAALLYLYGGYAYEAAGNNSTGDTAAGYYSKASDNYKQAWDRLKNQPEGAQGRAASLIGEARTTALSKGKSAQDGLAVLKDGRYDPAAISPKISTDPDAPDILYAGALLLQQAGLQEAALNAFRVSGVARNLNSAQDYAGVGRPLWMGNGTSVPAEAMLKAGDSARLDPNVDPGMVVMRYKQAYGLDSGLAPAWNNLGVWYAQQGNSPVSQAYLKLSGLASPFYALGNHNLATEAYNSGIGNFFTAESAQGNAIKANGAQTLGWGYNLQYDERSSLPSPSAPSPDFLSKLGALLILLLLLLHTIVGSDRMTNRMGLIPTRGLIGKLAAIIDGWVKTTMPALVTPGSGAKSLLIAIGIPSVVGMIALAWGAGHGSLTVVLLYLPVALVVSALAFAANEVAQGVMARRNNASTMHHLWPVGVLLGIVSIPFGFVYGWQNVTRLQANDTGQPEGSRAGSRRVRSVEELDLMQETQAEAAADSDSAATTAVSASGSTVASTSTGFKLSPAARIIFAGMLANLALGLVFGIIYWLTGWPSVRLGLFASALVLAFTSVSEPPADGWTIYRRNASLWLAVFVLAATVVTLLALGMI
jgi:tetratricopeptide (TPR) repeat protein